MAVIVVAVIAVIAATGELQWWLRMLNDDWRTAFQDSS